MPIKTFIEDNKAETQTMVASAITVIVLLAVLYVAIPILSGIESGTAPAVNTTFYNSSQGLITTTETAFDMLGILPIVAVSIAVIGAIVGIVVFA